MPMFYANLTVNTLGTFNFVVFIINVQFNLLFIIEIFQVEFKALDRTSDVTIFNAAVTTLTHYYFIIEITKYFIGFG